MDIEKLMHMVLSWWFCLLVQSPGVIMLTALAPSSLFTSCCLVSLLEACNFQVFISGAATHAVFQLKTLPIPETPNP